jgi:branched-chain amino acid transport system substrate-binding protein
LIGFTEQTAGTAFVDTGGVNAIHGAVDYINNHLNGVQGHPIKLVSCVVDGSPASAQKCAQQFASTKGLKYVYYGLNQGSSASDPILEQAGIFISGIALYPADNSSPNAAWITGGLSGSLAANAEYMANTMGAKKIGVVTPNNAQGLEVVSIVKKVAAKFGGTVVSQLVPNSSTDMTPFFQAVASTDAILLPLPGPQAISFMQAYTQQSSKIPVVVTDGVFQFDAMKTLGDTMKGIILGSLLQDPNGDSAGAKMFRNSVNNDRSAIAAGAQSWNGFMTVYQDALQKIPYEQIDVHSILAALSKPGLQSTIGPPYQCGLPSPQPAVCSFGVYMGTFGGPPDFKLGTINGKFPFVDARDLINAGMGS